MGLFSINSFVRFAVGAKTALDAFDKPEGQSALLVARTGTNRAFNAFLGHLLIFFSDFGGDDGDLQSREERLILFDETAYYQMPGWAKTFRFPLGFF